MLCCSTLLRHDDVTVCAAAHIQSPVSISVYALWFVFLQVDKSPEGQFIQLMALPRTLQQRITKLVDPPGKNRDVEEILLQVAQDPDCGAVVQQGLKRRTHGGSQNRGKDNLCMMMAGQAGNRGIDGRT